MKIIAFAGLAQAGKTTAAKAAAKAAFEQGFHPVLDQFARPLKEAAHTLGFIKGGEFDAYYRRFAQYTGTDLIREEFGEPNWWSKLMTVRLDKLAAEEAERANESGPFHETIAILDDVRFMNEVELVRKYSGKLVFISSMRRLDMSEAFRTHSSEQLATEYESGRHEDKLFEYSISNNEPDTLENFEAVIAGFIERLIGSDL